MFPNYSRVRLMTKNFEGLGAEPFDVGYIIEVYPNGDYEVEFSDAEGTTTAQVVLREEDIQLADIAPKIIMDSAHIHPGEAPTPMEHIRTIKERLP